nr:hypothetical protein GCM10020093_016060 [Planobispora longispora]
MLEKLDRGLPLPEDEQKMIDAMPGIAARLLGEVPMLEDVVEIVSGLRPAGGAGQPALVAVDKPMVTVAVGVLRAAIEFEGFTSRGVTAENAIVAMGGQGDHDVAALAALRRIRGSRRSRRRRAPSASASWRSACASPRTSSPSTAWCSSAAGSRSPRCSWSG